MAIFLDTNVLLYSVSTAPDEAKKRDVALHLLDRTDCVVSVQILLEFYAQATRLSRNGAVPHDNAMQLIEGWMRFPVQENDALVLRSAFGLRKTTGFSIWDCNVVAAARKRLHGTLHGRPVTRSDRRRGADRQPVPRPLMLKQPAHKGHMRPRDPP